MPNGGRLFIQTFSLRAGHVREIRSEILPVGNYTGLRVTDPGTGIAPDLLNKIFEPFFTTKEVGKGTGLGLSTVYVIVKQSGGFIFAESELGKATDRKSTSLTSIHQCAFRMPSSVSTIN